MLLSPEASVHAEIQRRLELADPNRRYRPVRARRAWPHLRELFGRAHRSSQRSQPDPAVLLATAGRHHLPLPPEIVFR